MTETKEKQIVNGLRFLSLLGEGSFGRVWKAEDTVDKNEYAVKKIKLVPTLAAIEQRSRHELSDDAFIEKLNREVDLHSEIESPFVVKYHNHWISGQDLEINKLLSKLIREFNLIEKLPASFSSSLSSICSSSQRENEIMYIQMEFCNGGTLKKFLADNQTLEMRRSEVTRIVSHLVKGLESIHSLGIVHRDIKPDNIFCRKMPWGGNLVWMIGDFGLSVKLEKRAAEEERKPSTSRKRHCEISTSFANATCYRSPEMGDEIPYTEKTDEYSLGLVFLELLNPYWTNKEKVEIFHQFRTCHTMVEKIPNYIPQGFEYLTPVIENMLQIEEGKRVKAIQVLAEVVRPIHFGIPRVNEDELGFVNNQIAIDLLNETLANNRSIILIGPAGSGKSMLILKLLNSASFINANVIWINLSYGILEPLAAEVGIRYKGDGTVDNEPEPPEAFLRICASVKQNYSKHKSLFVLDNFPGPDLQRVSTEELMDSLGKCSFPFVFLLVDNPPSKIPENIDVMKHDGFSETQALEYLVSAAKKWELQLSPKDCQNLVKIIGTLPLHLCLCTRLLRATESKYYPEILKHLSDKRALGLIPIYTTTTAMLKILRWEDRYKKLAPYVQSILLLITHSPIAIEATHLPQLLQGFSVPFSNDHESLAMQALAFMQNLNVIIFSDDGTHVYLISDDIEDVARTTLSRKEEESFLSNLFHDFEKMGEQLQPEELHSIITEMPDMLEEYSSLIQEHVEFIIECLETFIDETAPIGIDDEFLAAIKQLCTIFERNLGKNDRDTLTLRFLFCKTLTTLKSWKKLLPKIKKVAKDCLECLGPTDPLTISSMVTLAECYARNKRNDFAEKLYEAMLTRAPEILEEDVLDIKNRYVGVLYLNGKYEDGDKVMLDAADAMINSRLKRHQSVAIANILVGMAHGNRSKAETVEKFKFLFSQEIELDGKDDLKHMECETFVALSLLDLGETEKAKAFFEHMANLIDRHVGKKDPQSVGFRTTLTNKFTRFPLAKTFEESQID